MAMSKEDVGAATSPACAVLPPSWGNRSHSMGIELEIRFDTSNDENDDDSPTGNVHNATIWLGGNDDRDCEAYVGLLLGRNESTDAPLLMTYREYNRYKCHQTVRPF